MLQRLKLWLFLKLGINIVTNLDRINALTGRVREMEKHYDDLMTRVNNIKGS